MKKLMLGVACVLGGCSLIPDYQRPEAPTPAHFPVYNADRVGPSASGPDWQQLFRDPVMRQLIGQALVNNRDLRVAALNVEAFQAQYRIQRADLFPAVSATGAENRQKVPRRATTTGKSAITSTYSATLGVSAYELDFFGRVRSLSEQAMLQYLATEEARRSAQLSLVANVANAYLTWRADQELLALARQTLASDEHSLRLTSRSKTAGKATSIDVIQAQTSVESTRASIARYQRQVAQDLNSLALLVGGPVPDSLPAQPLSDDLVARVPAGLPSDLLQRRPDIVQAEYQLQAANANIGAARAAFFPSVTLTANAGTSSKDLSGLFQGGSGSWGFQPQINLPIFNAGSLRASLDYAKIQKNIYVAQYEKSIQTAFQEVSDGLAARQTYNEQLAAQRDFVRANQTYYDLAQHRYRSGVDSNLVFLDAQRSLFSSQQALIVDRLAQLVAEVNLYTALGGGWEGDSAGGEGGDGGISVSSVTAAYGSALTAAHFGKAPK